MTILFECETNIGKQRSVNEDSLWPTQAGPHKYADSPFGMLFIIADGMGGHGSGDIASGLAVNSVLEKYYSLDEHNLDVSQRLTTAITEAHRKILKKGESSPETQRMGTTVVTVVIKNDKENKKITAWIAWVGDSRAYLLRNSELKQLTRDHSTVWPLIENGITWDQLRFHPDRSKITNSLTALRQTVTPEVIGPVNLEPGDRLLLCSDGLTGEVRPQEISHTLINYPLQQAARMLIKKANSPKDVDNNGQLVTVNGGSDNVTAILVEISNGPAPSPVTRVPSPARTAQIAQPVAAPPTPPPQPASSKLPWILLAIGATLILMLAGISLFLFIGLGSLGANTTPEPTQAAPQKTDPANQEARVVVIADKATPTLTTAKTDPAQEKPASASGETSAPTATRRTSGTSTPPPTLTATATPLPTATPTPTNPPPVTNGLPVTDGFIQLLDPANGKVFSDGYKVIEFKWQLTDKSCRLPPDFGFELRVWREDATPLGAMNALEQQEDIQCDNGVYTFIVGDLQSTTGAKGVTSGKFQWDVIVVNLKAYSPDDFHAQSVSSTFELADTTSGGDSSGSTNNGGGNSGSD